MININAICDNQLENKRTRRKNIKSERVGETRVNNNGDTMIIVEYNTNKDITIKFEKTGELIKTKYINFKCGNIKSHFIPSVCNIGIIGLESTEDEKGNLLNSYICWSDILRRCYCEKQRKKNSTYKDVICCDEWLYYSNFKKFYDKNYYKIDTYRTELDKDILLKGNKIYSPETCCFVPQYINTLFTKTNAKRGELPIGVTYHKATEKYRAKCNDSKGNLKHLGLYNTPQEAFNSYKKYKENLIKEIANEHRDKIPTKLYEAMINYKVSIDD